MISPAVILEECMKIRPRLKPRSSSSLGALFPLGGWGAGGVGVGGG